MTGAVAGLSLLGGVAFILARRRRNTNFLFHGQNTLAPPAFVEPFWLPPATRIIPSGLSDMSTRPPLTGKHARLPSPVFEELDISGRHSEVPTTEDRVPSVLDGASTINRSIESVVRDFIAEMTVRLREERLNLRSPPGYSE